MILLETEVKMKLRCNVCDDTIVKEECDIWCKAERYSSIIILDLTLFWVISFWQINYTVKMMFYDVNDIATVTEQVFSIKFVNNDSSVAWESRVWKDSILSLERLNKYNCIYIQ